MSAVQETVTEAPAIEAVPKKAMTLGYGASLVMLALLIIGPLFVKNFIVFQLTMLLIYAHRGAGAEHPDRRQRPVLAGPERVLRGRRLHLGDPDGTCRRQLRADIARCRHHLLRLRIPVRPAGAAAERHLSGAGDLRAGGGDAAIAEARRVRALDRRRAGPGGDQARCAVRPADLAGHVAVLFHAGGLDRRSTSPRSTC